MKLPKKTKRNTSIKLDFGSKAIEGESVRKSIRHKHNEKSSLDQDTRKALSRHLHDLLNALWPAAIRIELASTEKSCTVEFRATLEQIGRCIEEAKEIASQASALINLPTDKCDF